MARKLPKPFQRPSIDLGAPKKEWQETVADFVQVRDIVQGRNRGLVVDVAHDNEIVTLSFTNGGAERFELDAPLTVFTEVRGGNSQ